VHIGKVHITLNEWLASLFSDGEDIKGPLQIVHRFIQSAHASVHAPEQIVRHGCKLGARQVTLLYQLHRLREIFLGNAEVALCQTQTCEPVVLAQESL
jgi:hypothetical protein